MVDQTNSTERKFAKGKCNLAPFQGTHDINLKFSVKYNLENDNYTVNVSNFCPINSCTQRKTLQSERFIFTRRGVSFEENDPSKIFKEIMNRFIKSNRHRNKCPVPKLKHLFKQLKTHAHTSLDDSHILVLSVDDIYSKRSFVYSLKLFHPSQQEVVYLKTNIVKYSYSFWQSVFNKISPPIRYTTLYSEIEKTCLHFKGRGEIGY